MHNGLREDCGGWCRTPADLSPLLTRFARWSAARAALQAATLVVVAIAVGVGA